MFNCTVATNILKQKTHELQSSGLQVRCLKESLASIANATLEVTNLPQDCTEEMLKLYFEDSECGGCSGAVKAIKIAGSEVAQVEFTSATSELLSAIIVLLWEVYTKETLFHTTLAEVLIL